MFPVKKKETLLILPLLEDEDSDADEIEIISIFWVKKNTFRIRVHIKFHFEYSEFFTLLEKIMMKYSNILIECIRK